MGDLLSLLGFARGTGEPRCFAQGVPMSALSDAVEWLRLLAFVLVPAFVAVLAHAVFRHFVPPERLRGQHDVAGFLVAVVGVLYSVTLGFLVVTVWTSFDTSQQTSDMEAAYVGDAFSLAASLPGSTATRSRVKDLIAAYAVDVRDREWDTLAAGKQDPRARAFLLSAIKTVIEAPTPKEPNMGETLKSEFLTESALTNLRQIADTRRLRLIQAQSRLPRPMYIVLVLGALMILSFVFFFGVESSALQLTMTALIAGSIGLQFGLIRQLSTSYQGAIRISPDAWTYVIENNHMEQLAENVVP
jgi:hypothetical protein